ncbi:MAG: bifunctional salicylyl-CoA 5-hydroxylase/oxidoreductase [Pseudophaeobacter sp. bin_em_oilr2.035]|uniref:Bifunctional salicylyl-CoA 5-hydroxylase/oxidoreductase n=1 Tax=Phaeobacter gallaeciensis TaxID=60890 RepID=A0ABD4X8E5_9RHOB|nr:bifunctional salicylyl-CoA 5-hydroxylase/oxidoreductase [Phaeobacter gallaeciensis]MDF1770919.1 bifunctional salicylyl-CoA 5-hydroxylase/oxidoreductase [Pseudophaeobacter sp. bin_em_oilr2.035]MDE4144620.1 bifunctional salicylyl-CoA 5-hydroxylase/oxidoreductase [Phaeobacter gallaeciensis]MDE4157339.1 bifunctional salicylyl-CoA 5-hydroxylase/oxidoreductase [Phaeobacter gallaeciensis]MDE4161526.1 bifunctional salicylyl-CoA 5-hydroxylase/oxidoreductase [Phaeobacter gallaeciensis]MDE4165748.1 bi
MKVACLGGGPAGLYFAISMKLRQPDADVTVFERNKADDTFGWGVVLSDDALENLTENDPESAAEIRRNFAYWDDIAVVHNGVRTVSGGHGFAGIGRKKMLLILQERARELGVNLQFETEVGPAADYQDDYDIVVACDGLNSSVRNEFAEHFKPNIDVRPCKFIWLGTHQKFDDAFTFVFENTKHGWVWIHAYQFDADTATVIVECSAETWDNWGFEDMSKEEIIRTCEEIFADHLGGHNLMSNADHLRGSAVWINFPRVLCEKWHHQNVVLLGDASATAHFSIGSGSRLAFDSAIALAELLTVEPSMERAFERYQDERRLDVLRLQSAARNSLEWFEEVERYLDMDPVQFNYSLLTRSQRISHENLRLRDPDWLKSAEKWFQERAGVPADAPVRVPMFAPYKLRDMTLENRIVVSPMAQYKAVNGCPTDWHLIHYGERAKGGAGMVYTEMTCVSAEGRITPGCPGLYAPEHEAAWTRLTDFVHSETRAKICCQIGHSGRKGSTQVGWEVMDAPLKEGNWDLVSASPLPWSPNNATPREITRAEMEAVKAEFVASAEMAERAGFDMIELHAAHGYLISSFISPKSNIREDEFGGSLENRLRYPLEVFKAMRDVWPAHKPMSVRISANDWIGDEGVTPEEAVEIAKAFSEAGADIIDVSAGQTSIDAKPVYGRMFQTPFSDRIRNEAGIATMAVGNIYEADHANSILMAGRADLICVGRPHLADPYWTLHEATRIGDRQAAWPLPYEAGRDQAWRLADRDAEVIRA